MSEKSAWQLFKEKQQLQESITQESQPQYEWADPKVYSKRLLTCIDCPAFVKENKSCAECGCFMVFKTKLPHATCPLNKWES